MITPLLVIMMLNAMDDLTASWEWLRDRNPRTIDERIAGQFSDTELRPPGV